MRSAVLLVTLVAAIAAEAPYHLPRPSSHAPSFNYPSAPQHQVRPIAPAIYIQPHSQQSFSQGSGYNYQQPSIQNVFGPSAPQHHYQQQSQFHFQPQPQYHAPAPQYHAPAPQYHAPAPQPQYIQPQPLPQYQALPQPQPLPSFNPAPQQIQSHYHQQQPINIPSTSYGTPQQQFQIAPRPIPQLPAPIHISQQYQPAPISNYYQQPGFSQGYSYAQQQPYFASSLPLQSQGSSNHFGSSGLSSYQADNNLYSGAQAQTHRDVLDSIVLDRVQNIIKDNEHSTARDAGYLSLVSGVSLENVKPSVELTAFAYNSPASSGQSSGFSSSSSSSQSSGSVSSSYGLPVSAGQSSQSSSSIAFLPNTKPASSYGPPN